MTEGTDSALRQLPVALPPDGRKSTQIGGELFLEGHLRDKEHVPRPPEHEGREHTILEEVDGMIDYMRMEKHLPPTPFW